MNELRGTNGNGPAVADGWQRLALAVLLRAARDAQSGNGVASEARRWLAGDPLAGFLLDAIDLDRRVVVAWVDELPALAQLSLEL